MSGGGLHAQHFLPRPGEEKLISLEADTRLAEHWPLELEARWLVDIDANSPLASFERDDYVQLEVVNHF